MVTQSARVCHRRWKQGRAGVPNITNKHGHLRPVWPVPPAAWAAGSKAKSSHTSQPSRIHLQRRGRHAAVLPQKLAVIALQAQVQQVGLLLEGGGVAPAGTRHGKRAQVWGQAVSGKCLQQVGLLLKRSWVAPVGTERESGAGLQACRLAGLEARGHASQQLSSQRQPGRYCLARPAKRSTAARRPLTALRRPCCWAAHHG